MPKNQHLIYIKVTGASSERAALYMILYACAKRAPDGCEFRISTHSQQVRNRRRREARKVKHIERFLAFCKK